MDNQHRKIIGYRELVDDEIDLMNKIKEKGQELETLVGDIFHYHEAITANHAIDIKWLEEGEMALKKGIMYLVRSVARPETF